MSRGLKVLRLDASRDVPSPHWVHLSEARRYWNSYLPLPGAVVILFPRPRRRGGRK